MSQQFYLHKKIKLNSIQTHVREFNIQSYLQQQSAQFQPIQEYQQHLINNQTHFGPWINQTQNHTQKILNKSKKNKQKTLKFPLIKKYLSVKQMPITLKKQYSSFTPIIETNKRYDLESHQQGFPQARKLTHSVKDIKFALDFSMKKTNNSKSQVKQIIQKRPPNKISSELKKDNIKNFLQKNSQCLIKGPLQSKIHIMNNNLSDKQFNNITFKSEQSKKIFEAQLRKSIGFSESFYRI